MSALVPINEIQNIEALLVSGDLSKLSPADRLAYYRRRCELLDLDPLSAPFAYLQLSGKLTLYATKGATEQIAAKQGLSLAIVGREKVDGVYIVTCRAQDPAGRFTESTGAVYVEGLKGEALGNAYMKAETKAKRRAVLSLCGLGMMDETEIQSIPDAQFVPVDHKTGEILTSTPKPPKKRLAEMIKSANIPLTVKAFNQIFDAGIADDSSVSEYMSKRTDEEMEAMIDTLIDYLERDIDTEDAE